MKSIENRIPTMLQPISSADTLSRSLPILDVIQSQNDRNPVAHKMGRVWDAIKRASSMSLPYSNAEASNS